MEIVITAGNRNESVSSGLVPLFFFFFVSFLFLSHYIGFKAIRNHFSHLLCSISYCIRLPALSHREKNAKDEIVES